MNNGILIFRTDRIGDFLLTLLLLNNIKKKYPNSVISVVASEKNYSYIKTFDEIDKVILLKNNFLSKIKLIFKLRSNLYDSLIIHDGKNRSKIVSFFSWANLKKDTNCNSFPRLSSKRNKLYWNLGLNSKMSQIVFVFFA